jgi:hypothetical protein
MSVKAASPEFIQNLKLMDIRVMIKAIKSEVAAIKGAGGFVKGVAKFCKSSAILTCLGIGIDIFFDVTEEGKEWDDLVADIIVDIVFGIVCAAASTFLASLALGTVIGTCIPIPIVGTIVGAAIGVASGLIIVLCTEVIKLNGISLKDLAKEGVKASVNYIASIGTGIGEGLDKAGDLVESIFHISSVWNKIFGGQKTNKEKTISEEPSLRDYESQVDNLRPVNVQLECGTTITFSNNFKNSFVF